MSTALDPLVQAIADAVVEKIDASAIQRRSKRLLTTDEAAEYLGVGPDTVKRLRAARKLSSVSLLDRQLLFDIDDLDRVIESLKERH